MRKLIMATAVAVFVLAGCAWLSEGNTDVKLVTQYAVLKVAENDPAKAQRIEEIALEVQRYATGEALLTVDALIVAIRAEIRWDRLDAADALLVNALLDRLRTELVERLGADVLPEDLRLAVDVLCEWIVEAARLV